MKTLTIVVPVSKMAGRLQNLKSWLWGAKNFDVRVIIVHDIQDENTSVDLRKLIKEIGNKNISYFEMKYESPGLARNHGLVEANSEWIMFVDSDDFLDLEQVFDLIRKSPNSKQILIGSYAIANIAKPEALPEIKTTKTRFDLAMNPGLWRIILPLRTASEHNFTPFRMGEDQEYLLGLDIFSKDLIFSNKVVYTYYTHNPTQLTANPQAISELGHIIPLTFSYLKKGSYRSGFYISVVLVRQIFTELKNQKGSKAQVLKKRIINFHRLGWLKQSQIMFALVIFIWRKVTNA